MTVKFIADKIAYEINSEEDYYMAGFSDNGDDPEQYVILQRAITFDKQDIKLGMNTYYFEYSDQSNSGYGICKNVAIEKDRVLFFLKEKVLNDIESIEITFKQDSVIANWNEFKDIFDNIFSDCPAQDMPVSG
jgi:hypothetical protein